jgi:hypothetical protein
MKKLNYKIVVEKSNNIHNNKYEYPFFNYVNSKMKIDIICPIHGKFTQHISDHIYNKAGCSKCKSCKIKITKTKSFNYFKNKANTVHNNFYDYSKAKNVYIDSRNKIPIICPIHGIFFQAFYNHVNAKAGCPKCKQSKGEMKIFKWLKTNKIIFETQKRFTKCKGLKNKLPFDFYLPEYNTCIEYDGEQHFRPVAFNGIQIQKAQQNFIKLKTNDNIKNKYCKENNITLLRISYKDDIEPILKSTFL